MCDLQAEVSQKIAYSYLGISRGNTERLGAYCHYCCGIRLHFVAYAVLFSGKWRLLLFCFGCSHGLTKLKPCRKIKVLALFTSLIDVALQLETAAASGLGPASVRLSWTALLLSLLFKNKTYFKDLIGPQIHVCLYV